MTDFERGAEAFKALAIKHFENKAVEAVERDDLRRPQLVAAIGRTCAEEIRQVPLPVQPPGSESREALERENTRLQGGLATLENILAALVENVIGNARFWGGHRFVGHVGIEHWKAALDWYDARLAASDKPPFRPLDARPKEKK